VDMVDAGVGRDLVRRVAFNLRMCRFQKGCTQLQLGLRVGMDGSSIGRYERCERVMDLEVLGLLAAGLEVAPADLL